MSLVGGVGDGHGAVRVDGEATQGTDAGGGREEYSWVPGGGEGAQIQVLYREEVRGDASVLAQVWQVLSFSFLYDRS